MHAVSIADRSTASCFSHYAFGETFSELMSPPDAATQIDERSATLHSSIPLKPFAQDPVRAHLAPAMFLTLRA